MVSAVVLAGEAPRHLRLLRTLIIYYIEIGVSNKA
jgi:hypothetical protein